MDRKLRLVYQNSDKSTKVRNVNRFAIHCADQIRSKEPNLKKFIKRSGIPAGYENEVSKALRIAEYVVLNEAGVDLLETLMKEI